GRREMAPDGRRSPGDGAAGLRSPLHLIRRALSLVPEDEVDVPLEIDLGYALFFSGDPQEPHRSLTATAQRAAGAGDRIGEPGARLEAGVYNHYTQPEGAVAESDLNVAEALPDLEADGGPLGLRGVL